jgi:hypothetical protein
MTTATNMISLIPIDDADVLEMLECEYENWLMWNEESEAEEDGSEDSRR